MLNGPCGCGVVWRTGQRAQTENYVAVYSLHSLTHWGFSAITLVLLFVRTRKFEVKLTVESEQPQVQRYPVLCRPPPHLLPPPPRPLIYISSVSIVSVVCFNESLTRISFVSRAKFKQAFEDFNCMNHRFLRLTRIVAEHILDTTIYGNAPVGLQ